MNKVILVGRLVRDPDVRYSQTGNGNMAVARYTLAVDRKFKKRASRMQILLIALRLENRENLPKNISLRE